MELHNPVRVRMQGEVILEEAVDRVSVDQLVPTRVSQCVFGGGEKGFLSPSLGTF